MNAIGKIKLEGRFKVQCFRNGVLRWTDEFDNLVVDEAKNYMLDAGLGGGAQEGTWYVGIFAGDYTPTAGDTGANFSTDSTEFEDYDEATRPEWVDAGSSGKSITNNASKADFTISVGVLDETIYGLFLVSTNVKGADGGTLFAGARFTASRDVSAADTLQVTYTVNAP